MTKVTPIEKVDVAINIFAKPFQTALSLLSLLEQSGSHVNKVWLQYEPVGSKYDKIDPYQILKYLELNGLNYEVSQPVEWLDLNPVDLEKLHDPAGRQAIRYQNAFENSDARLLFLMHNDILVLNDIIGALKENMGDAFAIGLLGQCWNCPASKPEIMGKVMGHAPCTPRDYLKIRPNVKQLAALYAEARAKGIFARPYDAKGFNGEFETQPWPLPECRVNEWACLLDLEKSRPLCAPNGPVWPPGAFRDYNGHTLDTGVAFFRDMHALGHKARHFDISPFIRHWVGTGNNTPIRYAHSEDRARRLLEKHYPDYMNWLKKEDPNL